MKITSFRTVALAAVAIVSLAVSAPRASAVEIGVVVGGPPPPPPVVVDRPWVRPYSGAYWIRPHYEWSGGSWVWVRGYYDYPPYRGAVWVQGHYARGHWRSGHWSRR